MSGRRNLARAIALLIAPGPLWGGAPDQAQLTWNELGPRIADRKIALVLPGGAFIEGRVQGVLQDGLRVRVTKTSDRRTLRKGEQLIPRQSVSVLRVTEYRKLGRILAVTGTLGAAAGIVAANKPDIYGGPLLIIVPAVVAGGMVGLAVGSYYAGKRLDRSVTEIRIVQEP
jgi:hypothetical protein